MSNVTSHVTHSIVLIIWLYSATHSPPASVLCKPAGLETVVEAEVVILVYDFSRFSFQSVPL